MPEIKELYLFDAAYASATYTSEWLNITTSQRLSIIVYCSSSYTTTVEYAIDTNYLVIASDVSSNPAGTQELDINSKTRFCRLLITGISPPATLNVQGFFHDTSLQTEILTERGSKIPVDTGLTQTAFGALQTESYVPLRHYVFTRVTGGTALTAKLPYSDILFFDSGINGLISSVGGLIQLSGLNTPETLYLRGAGYKYNPGQTLMARYTGKFFQGEKDPGGQGCTLQYAGVGNEAGNVLENFLGFGYGDDTLPYSQENFGIIYISRGVIQFIPKTSWNTDSADGTTSSLNITDWTKINLFQVELVYLGAGNINFKIMDVVTSRFVTVHILELAGTLTQTSLGDPNVGLYMQNQVTAQSIPLLTTDSVGMGSFGLFLEGASLTEIDHGGVFNSKTGITTEASVVSIRNDQTFYGTQNRVTVDVDIVTAAVDGNKSSIISFYKNATLTTPTWTVVNADLFPVSRDSAGTFVIGSGQLLWANALSKIDNITMQMGDVHIHLDPGDTFTITCTSPLTTDCSASIAFHSN